MKWPFVSRKRHDEMLQELKRDALRTEDALVNMGLTLIEEGREWAQQTANVEAALKAMTEDRNKWRDKAAKCKSHIERLEARIQQLGENTCS